MGDGEGRMVVPMAIQEVAMFVPTVFSEARTEQFTKRGDAAMGVSDLAAGAMIAGRAINTKAKSIFKSMGMKKKVVKSEEARPREYIAWTDDATSVARASQGHKQAGAHSFAGGDRG
ncbi:hypothetical protein E2562_022689 [Oryza meyeriana var. granulata]|uniref:Uncharacterized protein n=1 Tax=Oryza meyeriana var. granulata TaxID=110450 RepID=A0A6G1E0T3_9ORYZ|nr:hypothetical protein E2562_022689 [Oryza meyeriana var. granulata]